VPNSRDASCDEVIHATEAMGEADANRHFCTMRAAASLFREERAWLDVMPHARGTKYKCRKWMGRNGYAKEIAGGNATEEVGSERDEDGFGDEVGPEVGV
jgi:hypothetical protein